MSDHVERRAAALRTKGLSPADAEREAILRFGNVTQLREQSREIRLSSILETTIQDIRYAGRGMLKSPAFALTAILSLGLAIGANTAIYSIIDAAMLRPLPVQQPERLFTLTIPDIDQPGITGSGEGRVFSFPLYQQLRAAAGSSARLAILISPGPVEAQQEASEAPIERVIQQYVSGETFDILGVPPAQGVLFSSDEDRGIGGHPVAILSHDYWRRRFNSSTEIIGRTMKISGQPFRIIGVAREGFFGVEPGKFVDVWLPATMFDPGVFTNPAAAVFHIAGRLSAGATVDQIQARLQPAFHDHQQEMSQRSPLPPSVQREYLAKALRVAELGSSDLRRTFAGPLWIVLGVAIGILLIACANVASLLLARSTARSAEMAMRVSLGAGKFRIVRQLLVESLLLSAVSGVLGWILAGVSAPILVNML